jgi:hypothetical protein
MTTTSHFCIFHRQFVAWLYTVCRETEEKTNYGTQASTY